MSKIGKLLFKASSLPIQLAHSLRISSILFLFKPGFTILYSWVAHSSAVTLLSRWSLCRWKGRRTLSWLTHSRCIWNHFDYRIFSLKHFGKTELFSPFPRISHPSCEPCQYSIDYVEWGLLCTPLWTSFNLCLFGPTWSLSRFSISYTGCGYSSLSVRWLRRP